MQFIIKSLLADERQKGVKLSEFKIRIRFSFKSLTFQIYTMSMEIVKILPEQVKDLLESLNDYKESMEQMENLLVRVKEISEGNMARRSERRKKLEELETKLDNFKRIQTK